MHEAANAFTAADLHDLPRQLRMHPLEPSRNPSLVQDTDQIDYGVGPRDQPPECDRIMNVRFHHLDSGQDDELLRGLAVARGNAHVHAPGGEEVDDMAADKAGPADDQNASQVDVHDKVLAGYRHRLPFVRRRSRWRVSPSRPRPMLGYP